MTRNTVLATAAGATLLAAGMAMIAVPATAQTGRFMMEKTDEGYVRMDTETGDISVCTAAGGQIVCKTAADERAAFQAQLDELEARIAVLERRLGAGNLPPPDTGLPSEEEFERGLNYMERFMRRFMGIAREFEGESRT